MAPQLVNGESSSARIDSLSGADVAFWCRLFGVSMRDLRRAVQRVGPRAQAVYRYLAEHPARDA